MSTRPPSSPLNMGTVSPSFGAGMEVNPGAFYSLNNSKALQQQLQQQQEANIPIAPTLHWPTVAQAAALTGKDAVPGIAQQSPKIGSLGSSKSAGASASTKPVNYSAIVQDKSSASSSISGGHNANLTNVSQNTYVHETLFSSSDEHLSCFARMWHIKLHMALLQELECLAPLLLASLL